MLVKYLSLLACVLYTFAQKGDEWNLQNLSPNCMSCLCDAATGCDPYRSCKEEAGYCGPYKVARLYWIEAGNITMPSDDPQRAGAYEDCSNNYYCAQRIVKSYLQKFGKDCNGDGVTDCYDYMMINFNGGYGCTTPLEGNDFGRMWLERYTKCVGEKGL